MVMAMGELWFWQIKLTSLVLSERCNELVKSNTALCFHPLKRVRQLKWTFTLKAFQQKQG